MSNLTDALDAVSEVCTPVDAGATKIGIHWVRLIPGYTECQIQEVKYEMDQQSTAFFDTSLNVPIDLPTLEADYSLPGDDAARLMLVSGKYQEKNDGTGGFINDLVAGPTATVTRKHDPTKPIFPC